MSTLLLAKLSSVRRKRLGVNVANGFCAIVLWSVSLLVITMAVDWWIELPYWIRAIVLGGNLAGMGYFLFRHWLAPFLWGPDDDDLALLVEGFAPSFSSRLISSIQFTRSGASTTASASLVDALIRQTETLAESINFADVIKTDTVLRLAGGTFLLLVFAGVGFGAAAPAGTALLQRALLVPGVPVPRKTQVEVVTGNIVVPRGDPVTLSVIAHGVVPATGTVRLEFASGTGQEFPLDPVADQHGHFSRTIENVQDSFSYLVQLNDGVSERFTVRAEERPAVMRLEFQQVSPAYTGRGTVRRAPGDLSLPAGSRLIVNVTANKRLKITHDNDFQSNRVKLAGSDIAYSLQGDVNDTAHLVTRMNDESAIALPPETTGLSIDLIDEFGIHSKDSAVYRIDLIPDKPPTVTITNPTKKEELVTRRATVIVGFDAADEYGIAQVLLKFKRADGKEQSIALEAAGNPRNLRGYYQWELARLAGAAEEGEIIEWWIEVQDGNNVTGPGITGSDHYQLRVVSEDEKRAELMNRLNDAMSQINDVSENQKDLSQRLGKMISEPGADK